MVNHDQFYNTHLSYSRHHGPCLAKLDPTSTRKNAARCQSEGFSKYGGRCVKHNALPQGRHYCCMFKRQHGPNRNRFCSNPLRRDHRFLCAMHACRVNEGVVMRSALAYKGAMFAQFSRNAPLPLELCEVIQGHLDASTSLVDSLKRLSPPVDPPAAGVVITRDAATQTE